MMIMNLAKAKNDSHLDENVMENYDLKKMRRWTVTDVKLLYEVCGL